METSSTNDCISEVNYKKATMFKRFSSDRSQVMLIFSNDVMVSRTRPKSSSSLRCTEFQQRG